MNSQNLAIVFGPIIFRNEVQDPSMFMKHLPIIQRVMKNFIDYFPEISGSKKVEIKLNVQETKMEPEKQVIKDESKNPIDFVPNQETLLQDELIQNARLKEIKRLNDGISSDDEENQSPHKYDPILASELLLQGIQLVKEKKWEDALDKFSSAIDHNENLKEAYFNRGLLNYNAERFLNCVMDMYKVISLDPSMTRAYSVRALSLKKLSKWELAIEDFEKVFEREIIVNNYMALGVCYDKVNKVDQAIDVYTKFIECLEKDENVSEINKKNLIFVYCNRGLNFCQNNQFDQSLQDYTKAINMCQDESQIREIKAMRSKSHQLFGNEEKAIIDLRESLSDIEHYNNGIHAVQQKNYQIAFEHFTNAIATNSNNFNYFYGRSVCSKHLKNIDNAIEDLTVALNLNHESSKSLELLAKMYVEKGNYSIALKTYGNLIEISPTPNNYFLRGSLYSEIEGKEENSLDDYNRAIELDPKMIKARYNRGLLFLQTKEYQKALSDFEDCVEQDQDDSNTFVDRGLCKYYLKDKEGAIRDFNFAFNFDSNERARKILKELGINT
jgi:tetratricopeptide (TPR) repeat protein